MMFDVQCRNLTCHLNKHNHELLFNPNKKEKHLYREKPRARWRTAKWPYIPAPDSDLYPVACDLMELDTYLAGCFQRIIDSGELPMEYHHLLCIDENLTLRLSACQDERKEEFLLYKKVLDECILLAHKAINIHNEPS